MEQKEIIYDSSFDIQEFIKQNSNALNDEASDMGKMLENAKDGKRGNGFVFTYNNFTHLPEQLTELLATLPSVAFIRFQIEKGSNGTIHYQGYMHFSKRVYWGQLRKEIIKMGLHRLSHANRIASPQKASDYCAKVFDEKTGLQTKLTEPVYEWGELDIRQGERVDMAELVEDVKNGMTDIELLEKYPTHFFRYKKHIHEVRQTFLEAKHGNEYRHLQKVIYIYGSPRTGKTTHVMNKYGYKNVCRVTKYGQWLFENYKGQKVLLFDEFHSRVPITDMNEYLDGWLDSLRCRNADRLPMYDTVFVISNLPFHRHYPDIQQHDTEVWQAFKARFHGFINWDNKYEREYFIEHCEAMPMEHTQISMDNLTPLSNEQIKNISF